MNTSTDRQAAVRRPQTSAALLGAAILHLVPGILFWVVSGFQFERHDMLRVGGTVLLVALSIWARWTPLPPAVIALLAYLGYLCAQLAGGMRMVPLTIIVHVSILTLLIVAIVSAAGRQPAPPEPEPQSPEPKKSVP